METKLENKDETDYEYEIYVDDKLAWHGLNPEKVYEDIVKENPDKKVAVAWKLKEGILIARAADKEPIAPVFIADSEDVTPILGRVEAMDLFKACFDGDHTIIESK